MPVVILQQRHSLVQGGAAHEDHADPVMHKTAGERDGLTTVARLERLDQKCPAAHRVEPVAVGGSFPVEP